MFDNLFYGLAIGLILYNFFLFLSTRQNAFGLYAVHLAFAIVTLSAADEGSFFEIWPAFLRGYEYVSMFVAALLAMSSMLLFADVFMGVRTHMPSLSRANRTFAIASVLLALVVPVLPPIWMTGGVMILALLLFIFITLQSWILWRRGIANSGIYFFASIVLVLFIGMVFVCSPFVGIVNNTVIAHYGMNVGYSIQMLLLSVGLGRQINELKEKELAINTELLKARLKEVTASMAVTEAQAESDAKSRFLAAMSHEIRTPMNGVLGMTELLSGTKLDREQRHYVDAVLSSGRALLNILNDILDYSKIAAGKLELETIPFDMHRLSKDVMEIFAVQKRRQIHAALDIDPCVPALLCGDPTRLRQVLMNLLSNAFKFTESGQVSLRVQCVEQRASEVQVRLIVSDTGVGITPEQQKKLFQSFTQADASTTRRFGGTGLGLSISRDLIGLMGGTIEIESVPEQGTRVTVLLSFALPDEQTLREVQMAAGQPQAAQAMQLPGLCVLVAEDNPVNCMVVEGLLRRLGAHSTVVHHGQAALEVYREDHAAFDAILMDCEMPVMDGYAAVAAIRILEEENAWPRVPILALSAHMADESPQHAGFDAFLMKPVNIKQLHQALQRYWQA
jgi:hypothetical protein